jgi:hypothetical protein
MVVTTRPSSEPWLEDNNLISVRTVSNCEFKHSSTHDYFHQYLYWRSISKLKYEIELVLPADY